jgi:hypothetical protein
MLIRKEQRLKMNMEVVQTTGIQLERLKKTTRNLIGYLVCHLIINLKTTLPQ